MMKVAPLSLLLLAFSVKTARAQTDDAESCTPCEGGKIDPSLSFDGIPCTSWLEVAGTAPAHSPQCTFDRMVGVWFCGCPIPESVGDDETCTICENGAEGFNAAKSFPGSNITCSDISSVAAIDGNRTCNELSQMGDFCECPVSEENDGDDQCDICPNGGNPSNLDRMFLTTGETCQYAMEVLEMSPDTDCAMYLPDLMVDVPSFCGCPGSRAPKTCSLCPAGTQVVDADRPIQFVPGSTCADFEAYTDYVTEDTLCDYLQEVVAGECCEGFVDLTEDAATAAQPIECNFCPDGNDIALPDRELLGLNMSCDELFSRNGSNSTDDCGILYATELDMLIDTGIYCGCPEIDSTGVCPFCPLGQELLFPDRNITDGVNVAGATCLEYAAFADSTFDDDFCSAVRNIGELNGCCGVPESSTTNMPSESDSEIGITTIVDTGTSDYCDLCGGPRANVQEGDKVFLGTTVTCQTYHDELATIPKGDECDGIFGDFNSTFDPQIYCNCPGSVSTGACSLCPAGSQVVDPTIWISDIFTTCGQIDDLAKATSSEGFCSSLQRIGEYYCCYSPDGNGKRNLRKTSETATTELMPFHHRPYHFAAVKAIENVQDAVSNLVGKQASFDTDSEGR